MVRTPRYQADGAGGRSLARASQPGPWRQVRDNATARVFSNEEVSTSDLEVTRESGEGVDELLDDLEYDPVGGTNRVDRADDLSDEVGGEFVRAGAGRGGRPVDAVEGSADEKGLKWHR